MMEALPKIRDAAGGANPSASHHHHSATFLLPNELCHIPQSELLLPTIIAPSAHS